MQEQSEPLAFGKPMWLLWNWWRGDALPTCSVVSGLTVSFLPTGGLGLIPPPGDSERAQVAAHLLGLSLIWETEDM